MDGMNELAIAYILQGVLKALDYIHHMGYVHRCVLRHTHLYRSGDLCVYEPSSKLCTGGLTEDREAGV